MEAQLVPLENRALLDRVMETHDYEASLMALATGDIDPTSEMGVGLQRPPTCGGSPRRRPLEPLGEGDRPSDAAPDGDPRRAERKRL